MSSETLAVRLRYWGIGIAVVGVILVVFGTDTLIGLGATTDQNILFTTMNRISSIVVSFGFPLAAIFIGVSVLLPRLEAPTAQE